jgi:hypothetical protein
VSQEPDQRPTTKHPHLSIVVVSRNDDHGKDLLRRMQLFIDGVAEQAVRFGVSTELIVVEWNPPPGRPTLAEALRWPTGENPCARIVTVSPERHRQFAGGESLPLFQMIGKNVGIRRAAGEFVLATNVDILFSDALFQFLGGPLKERTVYSANRLDVDATVLDSGDRTPAEIRTERPVRRVLKDGTHEDGKGRAAPVYQGLGDLAAVIARQLLMPSHRAPRMARLPATLGDLARSAYRLVRLPKLHTNACGDFTLLSRDGWTELRGYPEWEMYSLHIDSILLFQAASHHFEFVELPDEMATIHVDHELGSGWSLEGESKLFERLTTAGVPFLSKHDFGLVAMSLDRARRQNRPVAFNLACWGLGDEPLEEVRLN